jgi:hypothetical protein
LLVAAVVGGQVAQSGAEDAALVVPGYGPGLAGHVTLGPTTPVCQPDIPCVAPFARAPVAVLDDNGGDRQGRVVARAVTNRRGAFIVSLPAGDYVVRVGTTDALPACDEARATVRVHRFTLVTIACDTGIR